MKVSEQVNDKNIVRATSQAYRIVVDLDAYDALLTEVSRELQSPVDSYVSDFEPPTAGMSEIAAVISFLADSKEVLLPVAGWVAAKFGGAGFTKFRNHLDESRSSKENGRPYIPLCVAFGTNVGNPGSVRFYFHGRPDETQLKRQFDEMYRVIDALPEQAFAERAGPPEYGYFWDEEQSRWRGQLYYSATPDASDDWLPHDLFDQVPGWNTDADRIPDPNTD